MHFNLFYLILQKALGKSRESHLNTHCRRPANRITELCAPINRAETPSHLRTQCYRHTPGGPNFALLSGIPNPGYTRPQWRGPGSVCRPRGCLPWSWGSPSERRLERRRAGRAARARGAHRSTTTLGSRPSVLNLRLVADTPELRNERGSRSFGLEESGAAGHWAGGGTRWGPADRTALTLVCTAPWFRASGTGDWPRLHLHFPQQGSWERCCLHTSTLAPASAHTCALSEMELDLATTFYSQHPWPGYYYLFLVYCNSFTLDKFFFQMNSKVSYLNHNLWFIDVPF